jgi:hypothetical protein
MGQFPEFIGTGNPVGRQKTEVNGSRYHRRMGAPVAVIKNPHTIILF